MRGREVQGFCFSAAYGHVSPNAGSETLVASSTMPPVTVWNASVARPLLSFVDSAGVRGICILFSVFRKDFFFAFCRCTPSTSFNVPEQDDLVL